MVGLALDYYEWARTGLRIMLNKGEDVDSTGEKAWETMLEVGDNGLDIKRSSVVAASRAMPMAQSILSSTRSTVKCPLLGSGWDDHAYVEARPTATFCQLEPTFMVGTLPSWKPHAMADKLTSRRLLAGPTLVISVVLFSEGALVISQSSATYWQHSSIHPLEPGLPDARLVAISRSQLPSCFQCSERRDDANEA